MPAPASIDEFLDLIRKSGVIEERVVNDYLARQRALGAVPVEPAKLAGMMIRDGVLTHFQAEQLMQGKWRRFTIGKYKVLEKLGAGGMGSVYLCEHKMMRRRVAVKVLPTAKANDPSSLQRFQREARAVAALDHPNIVHAYDIDQDESLHYLVMEYVDGSSLQDIVKKSGPLDVLRACHYVKATAEGLQHAHESGLVHRDIKPGNILVDRTGVVKVLDMGLARFFNDEDDILTKKYDENVLGTADYLSPEQAVDSHSVDIRADIYSLGATFYFMLTGRTPFAEGTVAQKLVFHQTRQPKPISEFRKDVPAGIQAIISKMMAKDPNQRYLVPADLAAALEPFTRKPIGPPPESEMPKLSPAAMGQVAEMSETTVASNASAFAGAALPKASVGSGTKRSATAGAGAAAPTKTPSPAPRPSPAPASPAPGARKNAATPAPGPRANPVAAPNAPNPVPSSAVEVGKVDRAEVASDTDIAAAGETTPQEASPRSPARSARPGKPATPARTNPRRVAILLAAVGVPCFLLFTTLALLFFPPRQSNLPPNPPPGPPKIEQPRRVEVSRARPNAVHSIEQALRTAEAGTIIELWDELHEETLVVDGGRFVTDVTLQAAPDVTVLWKPGKNHAGNTMLTLFKAANFRFKGNGIVLDGALEKGNVKNLVMVTFESPGLLVEDLALRNYGDRAVVFMNATGTEDRPITFTQLRVEELAKKEPIYLDAIANATPAVNDYIQVTLTNPLANPFKLRDPKVKGANVKLQ